MGWRFYSIHSMERGLNDFFICIEMFFLAVFHLWAFSNDDYQPIVKLNMTWKQKIKSMLDLHDLQADAIEHGEILRHTAEDAAERTQPLVGNLSEKVIKGWIVKDEDRASPMNVKASAFLHNDLV